MSILQISSLIVFGLAILANIGLALYFAPRITAEKIPMQWGADGKPTWYAGRFVGLWWQTFFTLVLGIFLFAFARYATPEKTDTLLLSVIFVSVLSVGVQAFHLNAVRNGPRANRRHTYCATPLPNDQFSFTTSTTLMNTSSRRMLSCAWRSSAIFL
jgi:hypothetical protein